MIRHSWDLSPSDAIALQKELAGQVRIQPLDKPVETVAGTDCAFVGSHRTAGRVLVAAVLCDAGSMEVLAAARHEAPCRFPYVPGLLSFREAPAVIEVLEKLPARPDLLICDGQGIAHPRGLGLATHVGMWLDLPTIGAAKSRLCGEHRQPGVRRGCRTQLRLDGRVIGSVVRTRTNVRPMYVSVGHRVALDDAIGWTLRCCRGYRLPEPTRQAHHHVTRLKKVE
jgi:deoxyribonuclease V